MLAVQAKHSRQDGLTAVTGVAVEQLLRLRLVVVGSMMKIVPFLFNSTVSTPCSMKCAASLRRPLQAHIYQRFTMRTPAMLAAD